MSIIGFSSGGTGHTTNVDRMVRTILDKSGYQSEFVKLTDLNFSGCKGCVQLCAKPQVCLLEDDASPYYHKIKEADAVVTAPISKISFREAGIDFPGHTELLAKKTNIKNYSMMFLSNKFKTGLLSTHIPLKKVSNFLTPKRIISTIGVISNSLKNDFGIKNPKIAILGLNPHAI